MPDPREHIGPNTFWTGTLVCLYLYLIWMRTDLHWSACSIKWVLKWSVCESNRFHWNKTCSVVYCDLWSLWEWMSTESGDKDWLSPYTVKTLDEAKCTRRFQRKNDDNWLFTRCYIFGMDTNIWVYVYVSLNWKTEHLHCAAIYLSAGRMSLRVF